jgi:hypothetical protein
MAEKARTIMLGGKEYPVVEVDVVQRSGETIAEYTLSDDSVIRVSNVATVVYRMADGQTDGEGNPVYLVKLGTSVTTVESPKLKQNPTSDGKAN